MSGIQVFDFQAEYKRLKEKIGFFEDVMQKEEELKEAKNQASKQDALVNKLSENTKILTKEIDQVKFAIMELWYDACVLENRTNAAKASLQATVPSISFDDILASYQDVVGLEYLDKSIRTSWDDIELIDLLEQYIRIAQEQTRLSGLEEKLETMSEMLHEQEVRKSAAYTCLSTQESALIAAKDACTATAMETTSKIDDLGVNRDKEKAKLMDVDQKLADLLPLATQGFSVRARKLEWVIGHDKAILQLGHAASHHGAATADASAFQHDVAGVLDFKRLTNTSAFKLLYHFAPSYVWQRRECKKLMEILSWRGSIRDYQGLGESLRSRFQTTFNGLLFQLRSLKEDSSIILESFFENEGNDLYKELKGIHEEALAKHIAIQKKRYS